MEYFLVLAAKSLLIAGGTLLLLKLMQRRSSSDRSWVAHLGLLAILLLPLGALALPALNVAGPAFLTPDAPVSTATAIQVGNNQAAPEVAPAAKPFPQEAANVSSGRLGLLGLCRTGRSAPSAHPDRAGPAERPQKPRQRPDRCALAAGAGEGATADGLQERHGLADQRRASLAD